MVPAAKAITSGILGDTTAKYNLISLSSTTVNKIIEDLADSFRNQLVKNCIKDSLIFIFIFIF
jgi:hypothetical protein